MSTKTLVSIFSAVAASTALISSVAMAQVNLGSTETIVISANQTEAPTMKGGRTAKPELPARDSWMNLKQAYDALEKAGYKDIRSIQSSRFGYIAHVVDTEEKRVRLYVHPTEGTVTVQERSRHDKKRKHAPKKDDDQA